MVGIFGASALYCLIFPSDVALLKSRFVLLLGES